MITSVTNIASGGTSGSGSVTIPSGTNRKIIVASTKESSATLTALTFDGTSFLANVVVTATSVGNANNQSSIRYYDVPDAVAPGSYTVAYTNSSSTLARSISVYVLKDVATGAPAWSNGTYRDGSGTTISTTLSSVSANVDVIACGQHSASSVTFSWTSPLTEDFDANTGSAYRHSSAQATLEPAGTDITVTATHSATDAGYYATLCAVAVLHATTAALLVNTQPTTTASGYPITPNPVVFAQTGGVTDADFEGDITAEVIGSGGFLFGTLVVNADAGVSTFTNLRPCVAGTYKLRFTAPGYAPVDSNTFTVSSGALILGGGMQRAMKDAETTANRKTISLDVRDSAGAAWAGSVTGVKPKIGIVGSGSFADATKDVIRPTNGGASINVLLTNEEADSGAVGDIIEVFLPAASGRLESTHGFYEITADDVAEASNTPGEIADAVVAAELDALGTLVRSAVGTSGTITLGGRTYTFSASASGVLLTLAE